MTSKLCTLVGALFLVMALFYSSMATLQGQGRPAPIAVSFLVGAWGVCVPLAYALAFKFKLDLLGLWLGMAGGYFVVTVIASYAAFRTDWAAMAELAQARSKTEHEEGLIQHTNLDADEHLVHSSAGETGISNPSV